MGSSLGWKALVSQNNPELDQALAGVQYSGSKQFYNSPFLASVSGHHWFQVLSNFANDYGDGIRGTDMHRTGEKRMVASGMITRNK